MLACTGMVQCDLALALQRRVSEQGAWGEGREEAAEFIWVLTILN